MEREVVAPERDPLMGSEGGAARPILPPEHRDKHDGDQPSEDRWQGPEREGPGDVACVATGAADPEGNAFDVRACAA